MGASTGRDIKFSMNKGFYAPPSRPEGPRPCHDRGNTGGALVFLAKFYTVPSVPTVSYVTTVTTVTTITNLTTCT